MKIIRNRYVILLLTIGMIFGMSGCGSGGTDSANGNTENDSELSLEQGAQTNEDKPAGEAATVLSVEDLSIVADISEAQGDLEKVNWATQVTLEEYDGIVASAGLLYEYDEYNLVVAFTNLYDEPVAIQSNMYAKDETGNVIGSATLDTGSVAPAGGTVLDVIPCGSSIPDGEILFENCSVEVVSPNTHTKWETEYSGSLGNGGLYLEYYIAPAEDADLHPGTYWVLALDSDGAIMGYYYNYIDDIVPAGYQNYYDFVIDSDSNNTQNIKDIACFVQACE